MSKRALLNIATSVLLAAGVVYAQVPAGPTFEVASVKPSTLDMMKLAQQMQTTGQMPKMGPHVDGARAEYIFMGIKELIAEAYKVKAFQITGPDWLNNMAGQRFDIFAKMPDGSTKDQAPQMLQALLAERFKLQVHRDEKEHPALALVVGKGGPKLQESPENPDFDESTPLKPGETQMDTPEGPVRATVDAKNGSSVINMGKRGTWTQTFDQTKMTFRMQGSKVTMSSFADMLTQMTQMTGGGGTQVVDMTGLKGNYVVALEFTMADLIKMAQAVGVAVPTEAGGSSADAASDPGGSTSLTSAVQALGLKLEQRKAPTLHLVVDHVEKMPTEN
jgi:uncharacterized protein (TIGR03435 family)